MTEQQQLFSKDELEQCRACRTYTSTITDVELVKVHPRFGVVDSRYGDNTTPLVVVEFETSKLRVKSMMDNPCPECDGMWQRKSWCVELSPEQCIELGKAMVEQGERAIRQLGKVEDIERSKCRNELRDGSCLVMNDRFVGYGDSAERGAKRYAEAKAETERERLGL